MADHDENAVYGDDSDVFDATMSRRSLVARSVVVASALATAGALGRTSSAEAAFGQARGGRLRVALGDSAANDTLDPHAGLHTSDLARARQLFETLVRIAPNGKIVGDLAESMEPNRTATSWQVRLRDGITFHNGRALTADDVLYTFARILNERNGLPGRGAIEVIDIGASRKVNNRTLVLELKRPNADLPLSIAEWQHSIVQDGATDFTRPVGTGPFMHVSFTPGDRSLMRRNPNYWRNGLPYVDELEIIGINDPTARLNALRAGQVDAVANLSFAQARALARNNSFRIVTGPSSTCFPIYMKTLKSPFRDNRVREAFRLAADRKKIVDTALFGYGTVGNDIQGKGFPDYYNSRLPQRKFDPERARFLLKRAGREGLQVSLTLAGYVPGQVEGATAYAETAKAAGLRIRVNNLPGPQYDAIYGDPLLGGSFSPGVFPAMADIFLTQKAFLNKETQWQRPAWDKKYHRAQATVDPNRRRALYYQLQRTLWEEGGYIIWGFANLVDASSSRVRGLHSHLVRNLGDFDFKRASLS